MSGTLEWFLNFACLVGLLGDGTPTPEQRFDQHGALQQPFHPSSFAALRAHEDTDMKISGHIDSNDQDGVTSGDSIRISGDLSWSNVASPPGLLLVILWARRPGTVAAEVSLGFARPLIRSRPETGTQLVLASLDEA